MREKRRFWIDTSGADRAAFERALRWLDRELSAGQVGVLALPGKRNIEGSVIEDLLGRDATRALQKAMAVELSNGGRLVLKTDRTSPRSARGARAVIAAYPTADTIEGAEDLDTESILMIPWLPSDAAAWRRAWNPAELGQVQTVPRSSCGGVVEAALRTLSATVNMSTGISHPDDRELTIEIFQRLHGAGETYDPAEVRAWLVGTGGWKGRFADDVEEVARGVSEGRRLRGGRTRRGVPWKLRDDIVDLWRQQAAGKTPEPGP